jgi:hypothetical protein
LEEAELHLARAAAHRLRDDRFTAISSITKACSALKEGLSLLP